MDISLRPITVDNWLKCVELRPTPEQEQAHFVAPNAFSLAQAHFEPWWEILGIYAGETMVGFTMVGCWPETGVPSEYADEVEPGVHCIIRFMIDGRYQGQGYGRAGLQAVLDYIRQQPGAHAVQLSYEPGNSVAAHLYARAGFRRTGRVVGGELEAWLDLT